MPPVSPGARVEHTFQATLLIDAPLASFTPERTDQLAVDFAAEADVPTSAVTVTAEAASVRLTVTVTRDDDTAAAEVAARLAPRLASADAATAFVGMPVEQPPQTARATVVVSSGPAKPPSPPLGGTAQAQTASGDGSDSVVPIVAAVGGVGALLLGIGALRFFRGRNRQEEVIVKAAMHTAPLAATKTQSFEYDSNDVRAV